MSVAQELFELVYVSAAAEPFSGNDLRALLLRSRSNNVALGVTGLLVHHQGSFLQVLEGTAGTVETLYRRILQDKRHHRVLPLLRGTVGQRSFGDWTMGFAELAPGDLREFPGFNDFFRRGLELSRSVESPARAKALALAFREGRLRQFVDGR